MFSILNDGNLKRIEGNPNSLISTCLAPWGYYIKNDNVRSVYRCEHCFANTVAGNNGQCEYCGSPLPINKK